MQLSRIHGFDWDEHNLDKCCKHGVSRDEIEDVFRRHPGIFPDPAHSQDVERFRAIGTTRLGRHIFIVFTLRLNPIGQRLIRPISARYMRAREVRHYERQQGRS